MKLKTRDIAVFAVVAAMMFASKKLMEMIPNVHFLGMFIVALTAVYRFRALIPVYVYIMLDGMFGGFSTWWWPYLYVWAVLWGMAMLIPDKTPKKLRIILYIAVCSLHGFAFGLIYMPAQAYIWGLDLNGAIAWWVSGLPFDLIHGISNLCTGFLIYPMIRILNRLK